MPFTLPSIFGLEGRNALVTGSSRGIGAAIAQGLAAAGAHVFVHGQSAVSARDTLGKIQAAGGSAQSISGDLSVKSQGCALVKECEETAGQLDIVVINASAQINADLADLTDEDLTFQINVNVRSTIDILQTCLPLMAARGWGRVVSIGSINQLRPKAIVTAYAATKAAQHNLIQSQARHYAGTGVVLNTLAPGLIDTDRNAHQKSGDPAAWDRYVQQVNWMGRAGAPEEMVGAAVFLASGASSFMTGEMIMLSGGF